jgi:ketosteroid isomerase-like protein
MSGTQQHIEFVQALYDAFAKRDVPRILAAPSSTVEWGEPSNPYNPSGVTRHGHDGF